MQSKAITLNQMQCSACLAKARKKLAGEKQLKKEDQNLMREFEGYLQTVMESLVNQLSKDLSETDKRIEVLKSI